MNQRIFPAVPLKPCPVCGADSGARTWSSTYGTTPRLNITNNVFLDTGIECIPLVCTHCGYVQFFVDVEVLQMKLNEKEEKRQSQNPLKW